ncbi:hypothetical protein AAG906_039316 [Vitis piasezkii]
MDLLLEFEDRLGKDKVCRLRISSYGLKQSTRAWFECFEKAVKGRGYYLSQADHAMFYRHSNEGKIAILIVYVDDIVLIGDDNAKLERLKKVLANDFEIKDFGALKYFLGMELAKPKKGKSLLFENRGHLQIEAYTNADWARSVIDRRSTSGYRTFVGGNLVTWCILWIKRLLEDLQVSSPLPMKVYCNNKAAILIAHNPVFHDRTKHIEVDKPIKEKLDSGLICMPYTPTSEQVVDILTSYKGATLEAIRQFDWQVGNGRYLQTSLRSVGSSLLLLCYAFHQNMTIVEAGKPDGAGSRGMVAQLLAHKDTATQEIVYFQQSEKIRLLMIVSGYYDRQKNFKRELLVSAESVDLMKNLLHFFNSNASQLPLKVLHQPGLRDEMRAFEVDQVTSRRTIEQLLDEFGGTSKR